MSPGFYAANIRRAFPFIKGTVADKLASQTTIEGLPNDVIADAGFWMGLEAGFTDGHSVWLESITRVGDEFTFEFNSDAPGLAGQPLLFTRSISRSETRMPIYIHDAYLPGNGKPDFHADGLFTIFLNGAVTTGPAPANDISIPPLVEPATGTIGLALASTEDVVVMNLEGPDATNLDVYITDPATYTPEVIAAQAARYAYMRAHGKYVMLYGGIVFNISGNWTVEAPIWATAKALTATIRAAGYYDDVQANTMSVYIFWQPGTSGWSDAQWEDLNVGGFEGLRRYFYTIAAETGRPYYMFISPLIQSAPWITYLADETWQAELNRLLVLYLAGWIGGICLYVGANGSAAQTQINSVTPANVAVGDVFTITSHGGDGHGGVLSPSVSFTATAATVANVTAGLAAACEASTDPQFTKIVWTDETTRVLASGSGPGIWFELACSTTNGGGANNQTLTQRAAPGELGEGLQALGGTDVGTGGNAQGQSQAWTLRDDVWYQSMLYILGRGTGILDVSTRYVTEHSEVAEAGVGFSDTSDSLFSLSGDCDAEPVWSGYLVTGDLAVLADLLPIDGTVARAAAGAMIEPALIQNAAMSYVSCLSIGNFDRTRATAPDECPDLEWTYPTGDRIYVNGRCLRGDVKLKPGHNCLLPDTKVQGSVLAATRVRYEGIVTEIVTRAGRTLVLTPHHPVLTENGFVAAGELNIGDHVIAYGGQVDFRRSSSGSDDVQHEPTCIKDVFESFLLRTVLPSSVEFTRAAPDDFHGDGAACQGEVEVVWADGKLRNDVKTSSDEEQFNAGFFGLNLETADKHGRSSGGFDLVAITHSNSSSPCRCDDGLPVGRRQSAVPQCQRFGLASDLDSALLEASLQAVVRPADLLCQRSQAFAGFVSCDEIIEIRNRNFHGHVYDLQTTTGLIVADGLYVSNCIILQDSANNIITLGAGVGAGEGKPCQGEVTLFPSETPPEGSTLLEGGPLCNEIIRSINGIGGQVAGLLQGSGVRIFPIPEQHTIVVNVNMSQMAICYSDSLFENVSESL